MERRLDEYGNLKGLVFGAFGEASDDVRYLIDTLAESRLRFQVLSEGREGGGSDNEKGMIVNKIRRTLSMSVIKSQVGCLLGKIQQAGPGNKQLAKKRERMLFLDEKMRQEKNSQFDRRIEGIRTIQRGANKTA